MIVKKAEYRTVMREVRERISEDVYGCDNCKKEFNSGGNLTLRVFFSDESLKQIDDSNTIDQYDLCSWKCVSEILPSIKTDLFVSLPNLHYDLSNDELKMNEGASVKDFIELFCNKR